MALKHFLFIIGLLGILSLNAQSPYSFDLIGGADYVYRYRSYESLAEEKKLPSCGWRIGTNFNYAINDKWIFKTGLRLASLGYEIGVLDGLNWSLTFDPRIENSITEPSNPNSVRVLHNMWLIELPLILRRSWSSGRWQPYLEAGVAPNSLVAVRNVIISDTDGKQIEWFGTDNSRRRLLHLVGQIGLGIQYQGGDSWQWFAQPTFRYHLFSVASGPIKERPYSGGLETGVRMRVGQ